LPAWRFLEALDPGVRFMLSDMQGSWVGCLGDLYHVLPFRVIAMHVRQAMLFLVLSLTGCAPLYKKVEPKGAYRRSPAEVAAALKRQGYEAVWKDWDLGFLG